MNNSFLEVFRKSTNVKNAATWAAGVFRFADLENQIVTFMKPQVRAVARTGGFKELGFKSLNKLLSSLHDGPQLQVFQAAIIWIEYNQQRSRHAEDLLLNVRLPLCSGPRPVVHDRSISSFKNLDINV